MMVAFPMVDFSGGREPSQLELGPYKYVGLGDYGFRQRRNNHLKRGYTGQLERQTYSPKMRKSTASSSPLVLLMLMAVLASAPNWFGFGFTMALAQEVSPRECKDEIQKGISACMAVAMGQSPSPACCARVRVTHPECVCPMVTPEVAAMVDPKKAKKLIEGCGRPVPPHFKCGSLTFP